jgi:hypothetical protein
MASEDQHIEAVGRAFRTEWLPALLGGGSQWAITDRCAVVRVSRPRPATPTGQRFVFLEVHDPGDAQRRAKSLCIRLPEDEFSKMVLSWLTGVREDCQ